MQNNMTKKQKNALKKICISIGLFLLGVVLEHIGAETVTQGIVGVVLAYVSVPLLITAYILVGLPVVKKAISGIKRKAVMDESFLMSIATFGAFLLGDLAEAVAVMLFFQVGEWFQGYAVGKSRKSIGDLMDICLEYANIKRENGIEEVSPDEVQIGDIIVIKPGERVPLDGVVVSGFSSLDTKAISGESIPKDVTAGDTIISGCINMSALLEMEVTKTYENSTVAKVLELVENASANKAEAEQFISKFARVYTPIVVYSALALAFLPPIVISLGNSLGVFCVYVAPNLGAWIYRGLSFLVTSCPCALVISIPLSFFGGIGAAGKEGILVKGSNYLETLANVDTVVMDKTGTLTKGEFSLQEIHPNEAYFKESSSEDSEGVFLNILAHVEALSNHPIAKSIVKAFVEKGENNKIIEHTIEDMSEIPGKGIKVCLNGNIYYGGNHRLMADLGFRDLEENSLGTIVHLAKCSIEPEAAKATTEVLTRSAVYLGYAVVADTVKSDANSAIEQMKAVGVSHFVILTGDKKATAEAVAEQIGINSVYAELLPGDKVDIVEEILKNHTKERNVCFVGDGMNDAPVLARADVGIAMGAMGSDAAIEAADIVIMTDQPSKIAKAMKISRKTKKIVRQNIVGAIGIKVLVLFLVAVGCVGMWAAVFADVGVAFIAILNAMRAMKTR